ncbi:MAG: hypothetical protein R6W77_01130 [Trueperaceae bacterium]
MMDPLRLFGLPTTFFVDASGRIVGHKTGEIAEVTLRGLVERTMTGVEAGSAGP